MRKFLGESVSKREIIAKVCDLRYNRDLWRKQVQEGESMCKYLKERADKCMDEKNSEMMREFMFQHAGAYSIVQERKGRATAFHISAHLLMDLLNNYR